MHCIGNNVSLYDMALIAIVLETFYCHGSKKSSDYILSRLYDTDCMCLTETWIKPSEHELIQNIVKQHVISQSNNYVVYVKTGMDADEENFRGRPYRGVAIICKRIDGLTYDLIECSNQIIIGIVINDSSGVPIHVLIRAFMPYFDKANHNQTEQYVECIDALQSIIDTFAETAPVNILGDLNVQLPFANKVTNSWIKSKGFASHSKIMYDFIDGNGFKVADLELKQNIDYTYFNIPRNINTWIDHIITTEYDLCYISSCRIIPLDSGKVRDHLPLRLCMNIHIDKSNFVTPSSYSHNSSYFTNWSRGFNNACYK